MYLCVGRHVSTLSTIYLLDFGNVRIPTVWYCLFFLLVLLFYLIYR